MVTRPRARTSRRDSSESALTQIWDFLCWLRPYEITERGQGSSKSTLSSKKVAFLTWTVASSRAPVGPTCLNWESY